MHSTVSNSYETSWTVVKRKRRTMSRLCQRLKGVKHFDTKILPASEMRRASPGLDGVPESGLRVLCFSPSGCPSKGRSTPPVRRDSAEPHYQKPSPQLRCRADITEVYADKFRKNTFSVLNDVHEEETCTLHVSLKEKARSCVRFFTTELGIKPERELPDKILCGGLRHAIRQCFPLELSTLAELSIKTSAKLEHTCCKFCEPRFTKMVAEWKEARFRKVDVDDVHLSAFKKALIANVPRGWNCSKGPFIPNGHGSLSFKRKEGGNWNEEEFSGDCRVELVFSSGKPRIVTCYSSHNTKILTPLHHSLYRVLERKGWLLVGDPSDEKVLHLNGGGQYLSFDYVGATDNIKRAYVAAAVDALVEQSEGMSEDQTRCLRVLSELRLDGRLCESGQPMGSVMSFPLLCLINKTVVDMSLSQLLTQGKISFKEWMSHRCLINGDDLLLKEPRRSQGILRPEIVRSALAVGMKVNEEKTLACDVRGEINSTLFIEGLKQKKTNAASLFMRPDVNDVLGMAVSSTRTLKGFRRVVRANCHILSKQDNKQLSRIPWTHQMVCRKDAKIRRALLLVPESKRSPSANFFTVTERPTGYNLTSEEEIALIEERVSRVRASAIACAKVRKPFRTSAVQGTHSFKSLLKKEPPQAQEKILSILARAWEEKEKERLVKEDGSTIQSSLYCRVSDQSPIADIVDMIRAFRQSRSLLTPSLPEDCNGLRQSAPVGDFLAFD